MTATMAPMPEVRPILLSTPLMVAAHAALLWAAMHWTAPLPETIAPPSFAVELEAPPAAVKTPVPPLPPQLKAPPHEPAAPTPRPVRKPTPKPVPALPPAPADELAEASEPAAATVPPAPAEPGAPATSQAEISRWQGTLLAHLERHKRYPRDAQMRRQEGAATIRFILDSSGHVLSAVLERGSGVESLDRESLALLERAQPLPRPPGNTTDRIDLTVPVRFQLR